MTRLSPDVFGWAVRAVRTRAKLTQKDLAVASRVGAQRISDIEQGRVNPTLRTIDSIAEGLEMRASELLVEADRMADALARYRRGAHYQADS